MNISWNELSSGLIGLVGALFGGIASFLVYNKQRKDQFIDALQIKFSEAFAVLAKVKNAELYTTNDVTRTDYLYNCTLLNDIDNLDKYLDLLVDDIHIQKRLSEVLKHITEHLEQILIQWRDCNRTRIGNYFLIGAAKVSLSLEEQIKWLLKEDRRTLGLALRAKESNMTLEELNKKFILIAKEYIDNNK